MIGSVSPPSAKILKTERRGGSLWLYSDLGTHRLSPKNAWNICVSFTCENNFSDASRPGILKRDDFNDWNFEITDWEVILRTNEITLKINLDTASYCWYNKNGNLLLQEIEKDSRNLEKFVL